MNVKSIAATILLAALCLAGDNGARLEDIVKTMLATMDKITSTLATIKDEETGKAAHPDLKKGAQEWLALRKRAENVAPPTKEEKERLAKEYKPRLEEAQKKLCGEIARVQTVPGGKGVLLELSKVMARKAN